MTITTTPPALPDLLGTAPADLLPAGDRQDSTLDEARQRAERLRAGLVRYSEMRQDIADAFACRDWIALGYDNWPAYVEGEFGEQLAQLARGDRRQAVEDLRGQGMSVRQIASATGISRGTVSNDLAQVSNSGHLPDKVTGSDGKTYAASRPQTPGSAGTAPPADPAPASAPALAPAGGSGCESCGGAIPEDQAGAGYLRCEGCDSEGDHYAASFPHGAEGPCVVCEPAVPPVEPEPVPPPADPGPADAPTPGAEPLEQAADAPTDVAADPVAMVAAALDKHVPDPGAPARAWTKELYRRLKSVSEFTLWLKAEDAARFADDDDVETLRQLALSFTHLHRRVVEARTASVTPLRRVK